LEVANVSLTSPAFFLLVATAVLAFHVSSSIPYRRFVLGTTNAIFLASYARSPSELVPLLGFLILSYVVFQTVRRWPKRATLATGILAILAAYIVLKRFSFIQSAVELPFAYLTLGLSYILFRMLQLIIDRESEDLGVDNVDFLTFFRFICNFLTFVSGPIQRYQDFAATDGRGVEPLDLDRVYKAFLRVVTGYGKFLVIAASANYVLNGVSPVLLATTPLPFQKLVLLHALCAITYAIYLYFNFSGYMDIVIGIGVLLGQRLPENFDNPFAARSFLELWQRWHMTLSNWFRTYLFNPLLMTLMTAFPATSMTAALGVVAFFITFLVMGIWHGTTLVCVLYGLLMGAGASLNQIWRIVCTKRLGKKRYRALSDTPAYSHLARGLTIAYFVQTLTYLWVPELDKYVELVRRLGATGECATYAILTLGFAILSVTCSGVLRLVGEGNGLRAVANTVFVRNLSLSGLIIIILAMNSLFNTAPEFIYRAF
jgi:alginate O-acetyltransferase complex protein AlgI